MEFVFLWELLRSLLFSNLGQLEVDAYYGPASTTSMVMLAHFLHCCPLVQKLRLRLKKDIMSQTFSSIDHEAQADFDKSVDRFRHRRCQTISLDGDDDDSDEVSYYIPGLSDESITCLKSYL